MKHLILVFCLAVAWQCHAAPFGVKDKKRIHAAVKVLFDSLRKGDIDAAYAMNTEETRKSFGSTGNFLAMLKEQYSPLYHHSAATVVDMTNMAESVAVTALIVDRQGGQWTAIFLMKPHADIWQIESCVLGPAKVREINAI